MKETRGTYVKLWTGRERLDGTRFYGDRVRQNEKDTAGISFEEYSLRRLYERAEYMESQFNRNLHDRVLSAYWSGKIAELAQYHGHGLKMIKMGRV